LVVVPNVSFMIDGLGSVGSVSWWVGLRQRKSTHRQLCVACTRLRSTRRHFPDIKGILQRLRRKMKNTKSSPGDSRGRPRTLPGSSAYSASCACNWWGVSSLAPHMHTRDWCNVPNGNRLLRAAVVSPSRAAEPGPVKKYGVEYHRTLANENACWVFCYSIYYKTK